MLGLYPTGYTSNADFSEAAQKYENAKLTYTIYVDGAGVCPEITLHYVFN